MIALWIILCVLAGILLIFALLWWGIPRFCFRLILGRPKRSKKVPSYYIGTPHYIASQKGLAEMRRAEEKNVYISSRDGLRLHAYLYPKEEHPKKFVIGIHGYKSYSRPEYGPYFAFYRREGYSMLLPDDRAHAPSEGKYIGFGVLDRFDCVDWCKYLVKTYGEDIKILLHGVSMGGATVLSASGEEDLPEQVIGIISDCGFSDGYSAFEHEMKDEMHLPYKWLLPRMEKICKKKAGYDFHTVTALSQVKKAKVPILFVHGEKDRMVPVEMGKELFAACPTRKRLLLVENAGHAASIAMAKDRYERAIQEHFPL